MELHEVGERPVDLRLADDDELPVLELIDHVVAASISVSVHNM